MSDSIRHTWTIAKRELSGYFASPVAYVVIVIFLLLMGFFTFMLTPFFRIGEASLTMTFFRWHPWLYLFLVPAVGMRLWAEERRQGTLELLLTMPITAWQAIVGKFLTFPVVVTIKYLGAPDMGTVLSGYLGSALLAGAYLAVTCFTSALTRNQVISFILSVVICFFLVLCGWEYVTDALVNYSPALVKLVASFSVMPHFAGFQKGVIDSRDLLFFLSVIGFSLFCNGVVIRNLRAG